MNPGSDLPDCVANVPLPVRFSGQSICVMPSSNDDMRSFTDPLSSKCPTLLFCRNGAVDQRLISDAGRVNPRPPPGISYQDASLVYGWWIITLPTDGRFLYDSEEKLSQMLPRMAFVASGLQAFVSISVTGTRTSLD